MFKFITGFIVGVVATLFGIVKLFEHWFIKDNPQSDLLKDVIDKTFSEWLEKQTARIEAENAFKERPQSTLLEGEM